MKGPIPIDLLEKGATVNSTSDCQFLRENSTILLKEDLHILEWNILKWYILYYSFILLEVSIYFSLLLN